MFHLLVLLSDPLSLYYLLQGEIFILDVVKKLWLLL